jgi:hypothetical protein
MTLAVVADLQIIGACCGLVGVAWALSYGFEAVGGYIDRTATKPDYHKIAFLERNLGYELTVEDDIAFGPGVAIPYRTREERAELEAAARREQDRLEGVAVRAGGIRHIEGRGHTNLARNVTDG